MVNSPEDDITLYSLNSIIAPSFFEEIKTAECITIAGGPHACARWEELVLYADYVVVGEGEFTVPRLLQSIAEGLPLPAGLQHGHRIGRLIIQFFLMVIQALMTIKDTSRFQGAARTGVRIARRRVSLEMRCGIEVLIQLFLLRIILMTFDF
jgi:radical SAM superfamily enzyme YgiQ (UPF0313 family)